MFVKKNNNLGILKVKTVINLKKKYIKNKIINNSMISGNKNTSEKITLKSLKELQKYSHKQSKKLLKLSIISALPILKIHKSSNKKLKKKIKKVKETPVFIYNKNTRVSLAIKFILKKIQKENYNFFTTFKQEIILNSQLKSMSIEVKNDLQKQALIKKRYLINYRWF